MIIENMRILFFPSLLYRAIYAISFQFETKQSIILRYMAWCDDSGGNNSKIVNTTYSGCPFPVDEIQHLTESIVDEQIALCCTKRPASNNAFAQSRSTNDAKQSAHGHL